MRLAHPILPILLSFLTVATGAAEAQAARQSREQARAAAAAVPDAAASSPPGAAPNAPQMLGKFGGWSAFTYKEGSGRVCYLFGTPERSTPPGAARHPPTAMVTHRPQEKVANVVSFVEGAPLKQGSAAALEISAAAPGGAKFDLFTAGDSAWARDAETDRQIVESLAKGRQAVFRAVPQRGHETVDTYALTGFAQGLALIDRSCGVKR